MVLKYRGDHTGEYDHQTKRGLVGKVVGPDAGGAYRRITSAAYDPERDVTLAESERLVHPSRVFDAMQGDDA